MGACACTIASPANDSGHNEYCTLAEDAARAGREGLYSVPDQVPGAAADAVRRADKALGRAERGMDPDAAGSSPSSDAGGAVAVGVVGVGPDSMSGT